MIEENENRFLRRAGLDKTYWQNNLPVVIDGKRNKLSFNVTGREAEYKFKGKQYELSVNPLNVLHDILTDIKERF